MLTVSCVDSVGEIVRLKNAGDDAYVRGDYPEAERQYKAALNIAEGTDSDDVMTMICLRSLAQVYVAQARLAEAEGTYRKRVELLKEPVKDPVYASTVYDDLATFYILSGKIGEAKPIYERAIALSETAYGAKDEKVSEKLKYYAQLLRAKNYEPQARQLELKAAVVNDNPR